ncbi:DUF1684 domain-containing protein [Pontibacter sp. G13]|uniref:DUF1684 domain-containing protein n=1 Tax=Pontibacter sp. G13 TaxID=3074898 RepID=UPI00288ACF37|nr:DUF1684 domain-containing protein [Pontibacter sp. G13]WNJ17266.1 DUF1684 domain-containing protein [Pontibacter sp. G13]
MNWEEINSRKTSTWVISIIAVAFLGILLYGEMSQNTSYEGQQVEKSRMSRNLWMKNSPESPMTDEQKATFGELSYFEYQDAFRVEVKWQEPANPDTVTLFTTGKDAAPSQMLDAGTIEFQLQGRTHTLHAFRYIDEQPGNLFIPFRDLSSGGPTYGGGRYLDVPVRNPLIVDFNSAYNPYCVYNDTYACPIPPRENSLQIEVLAGEKMFGKPASEIN